MTQSVCLSVCLSFVADINAYLTSIVSHDQGVIQPFVSGV